MLILPLIRLLLIAACLLSSQSAFSKVDAELRSYLKTAITSTSSFTDRFEAEVWLVDMSGRLSRYIKDKQFRIEFLKALHQSATKENLPPEMVLALINIESAFKPYALSVVGAQGYMQIMPFWRKEIGRPEDNLMNYKTNLRYGCAILAHYLKREKGNWTRALARYNGSLGKTWYPEKVMNAWQKRWFVQKLSQLQPR
jgi:soluble lytic murein transglycosylase-like protein